MNYTPSTLNDIIGSMMQGVDEAYFGEPEMAVEFFGNIIVDHKDREIEVLLEMIKQLEQDNSYLRGTQCVCM